jgi:hypothetical protein
MNLTSFPQRQTASAKQILLFELTRARAAFLSAVQGLSPGSANEPIAEGTWSPREIVLHVASRDEARLRELDAVLQGAEASWRGAEQADWAKINETNLAPLRHHDWEEALRLLHRNRQELMEKVERVPEQPAEVWSTEHPFGWMMGELPKHDRHHGEQIKHWRAHRGA